MKCRLCELRHNQHADLLRRFDILKEQHDVLYERKRKRDEETIALLALIDRLQKENAELRRESE